MSSHPASRSRARSTRSILLLAPLASIFLASVACGPGVAISPAKPKAGYGDPCKTDSDCGAPNGEKLVCGVDQSGQPACVASCVGAYGEGVHAGVPPSNACINGRVTPCEQLPAATTCGCGCPASTYCLASTDGATAACVPTLAAGVTCLGNAMCQSDLCCSGGTCGVSGTCSVPIGAACTGQTDCPACFLTSGGQPLWCSMSCSVSTSASGIASNNCPYGFVCLGASAPEGYCYEQCNSAVGDGLTGSTGCPTGSSCLPYAAGSPNATGTASSSGYACQ